MKSPLIIIGTGIAAYTLAREFRKLDTTSPLMLISEDDGASYPKPMLSNALTKNKTAEDIVMFDAEAMAEKLNAEIKTNTQVKSINTSEQSLMLSDGSQCHYSQLVLAVGANPITLPMKGDAADELLSINNLSDYSAFREQLEGAKKVAIIGPGLIGCEFANDLLNAGIKVSIIGPSEYPMNNLLPKQVGEALKLELTSIGAQWHLETAVESVNKSETGEGYQLALGNGEIVEADLVLSVIGLRANIELAKQTGLELNRGIVTDRSLQTSVEKVYALGDCAEVAGHNLLYIAPIMAGAKALAKTLAGTRTQVTYPAMPVAIKTPCYPLLVAAPARQAQGEWHVQTSESGFGLKALFKDENEHLLGFVLSGDMLNEKRDLTAQLADVLGAE